MEAERAGRLRAEALARRTVQLQELTAALAQALTPSDAASEVARATRQALNAGAAMVWLCEPGGDQLELAASEGYQGPALDGFRRFPLAAALPACDAVRQGHPIFLGSRAERLTRYPLAGDGSNAPFQAWAAVPLLVERRVVGVLSLSFPHERTFSDDDQALMSAMGAQSAQVIERTRLFEAERRAQERACAESLVNETLYRLGSSFATELDPEKLVQLVTDEATRLTGAAFGAFFFNGVRPGGESYRLYTIAGVPKEVFRDFPEPRATPLFGPTFRGEGRVRIDDVRQDPRFGQWGPQPAGHPPVVSYLAVPVISRAGQVLGGLFFGHPEPGRFGEQHERIVAGIASQAAVAIENAQLYAALRDSEAKARAAERRKDEFLAMLGHELRNPLAPIVTALELMRLKDAGAERERNVIERQVEHLSCLVDDLLDVARITRGKVELRRETLEAAALVAKAIEMASPLLERNRHSLSVSVPRAGLLVHVDSTRMAQVLANLLTNAAKYTAPGGRISLRVEAAGDELLFRVKDNGVGIRPELLSQIFDLFVQGDRSLDRAQGGLGLGLTLVRSLVDLHGGRVEALSEGPGRGSEFVVRIPRGIPAGQPASPPPAYGPMPAPEPRRTVLVVDDNVDAAQTLAELLRLWGHEVAVRHDGPSALSAIEAFPPEVALVDIGLPVMDGYELAGRIRAALGGRSPLLIALTGYGQYSDRQRAQDAGFDEHLVKPVDVQRLRAAIQRGDRAAA